MMFTSLLIAFIICEAVLASHGLIQEYSKDLEDLKAAGDEIYLPFDEFMNFPTPEICSSLKKIELIQVQFDPNVLIKSLEGCNKLTTIELFNVVFTQSITVGGLVLPKLKRFELSMYFIEAKSAEELMAYLFFYEKDNEGYVPPTIRIESNMDGKYMKYNSMNEEEVRYLLELKRIDYDLSPYFYYEKLTVERSALNERTLKVDNLTQLTMKNSSFQPELFEVLKSAENLIQLDMTYSGDAKTAPLSIDISMFPSVENFEKFAFQNVHVWSSKFVHLKNISSFTMKKCSFNVTQVSLSNLGSGLSLTLKASKLIGATLNTFMSTTRNIKFLELRFWELPAQELHFESLRGSVDTLFWVSVSGLNVRLQTEMLQFTNLKMLFFSECQLNEAVTTELSGIFPRLSLIGLIQSNTSYPVFQEAINISSLTQISIIRSFNEIPEINKFLLDSEVSEDVIMAVLEKSNETVSGWSSDYSRTLEIVYNPVLRELALYAYIVILALISGFGFFGNILSAIVLTRKNMKSSTSFILLGLTFSDTLVIITYACSMHYFAIKLILVFLEFKIPIDNDDEKYTVLGCGVTETSVRWLDEFQYGFLYPLNKTVYATVLLTLERYVAVCWPLRSRRLITPKKAICAVLVVLAFSILLNFPRWIEAHQYISKVGIKSYSSFQGTRSELIFRRTTAADGLLRYRSYRKYFHGFTWITFMYILPISALTIFNFRILKQLNAAQRSRAAMAATHRPNRNSAADSEQDQLDSLTRMLLCVIFIFVVCNCTSGCIIGILMSTRWEPTDIEVFSCIPLLINSSANFIIYTSLGSKFRKELLKLILTWKRRICIQGRSQDPNLIQRHTIALSSFSS